MTSFLLGFSIFVAPGVLMVLLRPEDFKVGLKYIIREMRRNRKKDQ